MNSAEVRRQGVFGASDGVTIALGLIIGLAATQPHAVFRAALAAGTAELVGMTAGAWLSNSRDGLWPPLANEVAALAACVLPGVPCLLWHGWAALLPALVLVLAVAGGVAWLRPQRGWQAVLQPFGVLAAAAVFCYLANLI